MADSGSSNTGVVAVLVIFVIVVVAAFFAWRGGMFGGRSNNVDVKIEVPSRAPSPEAPPAPPEPAKPDNN